MEVNGGEPCGKEVVEGAVVDYYETLVKDKGGVGAYYAYNYCLGLYIHIYSFFPPFAPFFIKAHVSFVLCTSLKSLFALFTFYYTALYMNVLYS